MEYALISDWLDWTYGLGCKFMFSAYQIFFNVVVIVLSSLFFVFFFNPGKLTYCLPGGFFFVSKC
jgi:hypothetical protein